MFRLLFVIFFINSYLFSIVTIEPVEPNEKSGLSGEVDGSFKESSGNIERKDYSRGLKLQFDYKDNIAYAINNNIYAESEGQQIEDNSFIHFRHITKLDKLTAFEIYLQSEENKFLNLNLRELAGASLRFGFFRSEDLRLYFGAGAYASNEKYASIDGDNISENTNRGNIYLSYKQKIEEKMEAIATGYYQPAFKDSNDYYLLINGNINFFLTEKLALKLSFGAKEDTKPFESNKKSDSYYLLGIGYKF
ncbi:MAG: hypothetical protein QG567_877 [Campylobacterota bacterium]|nr:hypothetical protein [Campylobacterota bacterium]